MVKLPDGRIEYASPFYDYESEEVRYKCCGKTLDEVEEVEFPDVILYLRTTFSAILAELENTTQDEIEEKYDPTKFFADYIAKFAACKSPKPAYWDYRYNGDVTNEQINENLQRYFADCVKAGFVIVEIAEPEEGNSVFIAMKREDLKKLKAFLRPFLEFVG